MYLNNITDELDKHMLYDNRPYGDNTYLCQWDKSNPAIWSIRVPGATRGCIMVDESNIIQSIELYEETCFTEGIACYARSAVAAMKQFIGTKLEVRDIKWL